MSPLATLPTAEVADPSSPVRITDNPLSNGRVRLAIQLPPGAPDPWWAPDVEARLGYLGSLDNDWNSYGAKQPTPEAMLLGVRVIASLLGNNATLPMPQIVPTRNGGLQLEWHIPPADIEISVEPHDAVWAYIDTATGSFDGPLTQIETQVSALLNQAAI